MSQNTIPLPRRPRRNQAEPKDPLTQLDPGLDQNFQHRALFEQTEDCVFIISFDLRYIAVNPQVTHLLGYSEQELIGKPVSEIMFQDAPFSSENILGNTSNLFERLMHCKDGSTLPVEIRTSIVYSQDGAPAYVQTIARDITERKTSEEHSRAILAALPDLIIRVDQFGNILDYSARKDHPLYMQREAANGKKLSEIWNGHLSQQVVEMTGEQFLVSAHIRKEFRIPGSNKIYEAHLDPISATETLMVIRDISDQARLNQMKTDFINRASHELRTPLTTAMLMCELIQGGGDAAELAEYWQILNSELNRQKSLIDRLLMAGRLESGKLILEPETLDVKPILEESALAVKSIAKKRNISIKISAPAAALMAWGDKSGLQQVFINLINNAVKFSPEGSLVKITAAKRPGQVRIAISDQGLGIPPEDLPNLFEQFFRARNVTLAEIPGSGVGLYIVKSIIEELKGTIRVESKINAGTTFIITLKTIK